MASKRVQFLRYDKQKKSCKDCFHDCVCPHLRDNDAEKCGAYITDVAPVVHGRWTENENCTICGGSAWYYDWEQKKSKSRYCPNCGAKMDGVQNE